MHPMMGLAALHGLVALQLGNIGWRLARIPRRGERAIRIIRDTPLPARPVAMGTLGSLSIYESVALASIPDEYWEFVTEEMMEELTCTR